MSHEIQQEDNGQKGSFFIELDGKRLAQMTYVYAGEGKIIIDHTEVDDSLRGTGTGQKLVDAGADWARSKQIKILPLCPFAKKVMTSDRDKYADVLA